MKRQPTVFACLLLILRARAQPLHHEGGAEKVSYAGNQLWKVAVDNQTDFKLLQELQEDNYLTMWGRNTTTVDVMVTPTMTDKLKEKLLSNHLRYEVSLNDIQQAIDSQNPDPSTIELDDRKGHKLTWQAYYRLWEIYGYLHYLAESYPQLCSVRTIGRSYEGRPIKLLKISNGRRNNTAIWLDAGIHAREWITPAVLTYIVETFVNNYEYESAAVRNIDWYIVPVLNPDGYEYTYTVDRLWRKNRAKHQQCVGVDLNRNFGYQWGAAGASQDPCKTTFRGTKAFSEPETAAVANFFAERRHKRWRGYVSFHSYGQYIVYPWGSTNVILDDYRDLEFVATKAAQGIVAAGGVPYTVGPTGLTIYTASGSSADWARGAMAIKYAYTVELRDTGRYGFLLPAKFIQPTAEEGLIIIRTVAQAAVAS